MPTIDVTRTDVYEEGNIPNAAIETTLKVLRTMQWIARGKKIRQYIRLYQLAGEGIINACLLHNQEVIDRHAKDHETNECSDHEAADPDFQV